MKMSKDLSVCLLRLRCMGQRELQVSSFKIAVDEDRKLLMGFGAGKRESSNKGVTPRIENFINTITGGIGSNPAEFADVLPVLEYLARRFPKTYLRLADLVLEVGDKELAIDQAKNYLRRFLESAQPAEKRYPWLNLADLCARSGDSMGEVHAFCEVALLPYIHHVGPEQHREQSQQSNSRSQGSKHSRCMVTRGPGTFDEGNSRDGT